MKLVLKWIDLKNHCIFIKEKFEPGVHYVNEKAREETAITRHTGLEQVIPSALQRNKLAGIDYGVLDSRKWSQYISGDYATKTGEFAVLTLGSYFAEMTQSPS